MGCEINYIQSTHEFTLSIFGVHASQKIRSLSTLRALYSTTMDIPFLIWDLYVKANSVMKMREEESM